MAKIITYECNKCGSEVVVTEAAGNRMAPVYCCGVPVTKVHPIPKASAKPRKTASKTKGTRQKKRTKK